MQNLEKQILEQGRAKMEYYIMLAKADSVNVPVGIVELSDGRKAQVQLRVITNTEEFIESPEYEIDFANL